MSKITLKVEVDESMYKCITNKDYYKKVNDVQVYKERGEFVRAMQTAIPITECDDAISRDMVIKAVDAHTNEDGTLDDDISIILEDLPSVIPKREQGEYDEDYKTLQIKLENAELTIENLKEDLRQAREDLRYAEMR